MLIREIGLINLNFSNNNKKDVSSSTNINISLNIERGVALYRLLVKAYRFISIIN